MLYSLKTFFFQAEDGIRDFHVTGVQTCALPIYRDYVIPEDVKTLAVPALAHRIMLRPEMWVRQIRSGDVIAELLQIGRASCRERVEIQVIEVCVVKHVWRNGRFRKS